MKYNRKIDIIIPAYNVPDKTLFKCLSSIACQTISEDLQVTIVDDASTTQNYQKVIKFFKPFLNIQILRYEINGGPGVARQYGIDHTNNEYLTFIDADDTFAGAFSLQILRQEMETNENHKVCVGCFEEVIEDGGKHPLMFSKKEEDLVWMFGKLYKREFFEEYNIRFHPTSRANEDSGFNGLVYLFSKEKQILYLGETVYYWHENPTSITRINEGEYSYSADPKGGGFYGFVENLLYIIQTAQEQRDSGKFELEKLYFLASRGLSHLYFYYVDCWAHRQEYAEKNFELCKKFYQEGFAPLENEIPQDLLFYCHHSIMRDNYVKDEMDFIPHITFMQFLEQLKED